MRTCHRHYPGRFNGACSLVCLHCQRPSPCNSKVGSCNCFFEACSAFTHVMACTLAESPSDPLHRKLRQLRCLRCRFDCFRVERTSSRAGVAPAEVQRLSRRTVTSTSDRPMGSVIACEIAATRSRFAVADRSRIIFIGACSAEPSDEHRRSPSYTIELMWPLGGRADGDTRRLQSAVDGLPVHENRLRNFQC